MNRFVLLVMLIATLVACHPSLYQNKTGPSRVEEDNYLNWADPCVAGYRCTFMYRDDIKRAAETANLICGASHDSLRLAVAIIGNDLEQVRKAVPVYVVENANNPPCEVPYSHRVIVIDEQFPSYLNKQFLQGGLIESTYMISSVDLLTVLLLHELGHLAHTDYKKDIAYRFSSVLNDEKTVMKEVEEQADQFAVTVLRNALRDTQNTQRALAARHLVVTLGLAQLNLSYIRQKNGVILTNDALSYYMDRGYTHQNTELRLLTILHETTMDFGSLITDFETIKGKLKRLQTESIPKH
jgi:hypothetical protein